MRASATQSGGRPIRSAVLGYYGRWNLGDDLMARDLASALAEHGREARLLVGDAYLTAIVSGSGVSTAPRNALGLLAAVIWCDELLFAGGTIFHDSYKGDEARRYIRHLWVYAVLMRLARLLGKTVRMVGVGIGPLRRKSARAAAAMATGAARSIYVRDIASRDEVMGLSSAAGSVLIVGPDLAWLGADHLIATGGRAQPENRLGLSLLNMGQFLKPDDAGRFWAPIAQAIAGAMEDDRALKLTVMAFWTAPGRPGDVSIAEAFVQELPAAARSRVAIFAYSGDPNALVREMANCRAILATRFHAAVLAQALGRPYAVVAYNRKVSDLADTYGLPDALRLAGDTVSDATAARAVIDALLAAEAPPTHDAAEAARAARAAVAAALGEPGQ